MALTNNNCFGAETGGLEEVVSVVGSVSASTAQVRTGTYSYLCPSSSDNFTISPFDTIASGGDNLILGFGLNIADVAPVTTTLDFIRVSDSTSVFFNIDLDVNNDWIVQDAEGANVGSPFDPGLTNATYALVEIYLEHSASGAVEIFINGVSKFSASAQDFTDGGTLTGSFTRFRGYSVTNDTHFDDIYVRTGASSSADRLGGSEVFKYQSIKASATPDDGGGNLNTGNWSDAGETPGSETNVAIYTSAGAGAVDSDDTNGSPEGPKNDARIDGDSNIKLLKGVWHMKRGTGGGAAHYGLLGNDVDGTARSADFDPGTVYVNKFHLTEASGGAAGDIPLSTEYCRIGFETDGAQDFDCGDMWAMLLHVPAAGAVPVINLVMAPYTPT